MRRPKLELDIETALTALSKKMIAEKRTAILMYCIKKKQIKNFDLDKLSHSYEKVKNYSLDVLSYRYEGELLFREYKTGIFPAMLNKRYELAV
ncbi:hypothetical protein CMU23_01510 [Elizabethkingia anophelis]|uniref:hypothetical protein n=1 Tax=Elizabethkingia anophelis TaxID=1117645 RepID=UPI0021A44016|nr:hypothetical protein [Elizabethkingia anophelis]MCT3680832.1 hypothetical protein [Elizabethkingia anophelis]MDV3793343.1 hypothetical protein [Elizabethkingia anophelis]MDV3830510.1 hypothetical protein [Elizabethkingia anophelis]HAY3590634.1 hypothetical protein [Elizabethkingia anophelis]